MYQTCTEFGYYQTSDDAKQPFGHQFSLKLVALTLMSCHHCDVNKAKVMNIKAKAVNLQGQFYGHKPCRLLTLREM